MPKISYSIFNKVYGYSCMVNKEVYFVVDTSCKMASIHVHQAATLHFEMIHHTCISEILFPSFLVVWTWVLFRFAEINAEIPGNFSVMHGFIYDAVLKMLILSFKYLIQFIISLSKITLG